MVYRGWVWRGLGAEIGRLGGLVGGGRVGHRGPSDRAGAVGFEMGVRVAVVGASGGDI